MHKPKASLSALELRVPLMAPIWGGFGAWHSACVGLLARRADLADAEVKGGECVVAMMDATNPYITR
jgi:hypothetical protein